ncbi:general secretion pathway protein [Flavobacterium cheonhonense]|uniref:General secretion pathway protein n=1 Tax=Flavobacterium cheonhonense TaxID=706185 RepID=A0ABP7TJ52_9FLAO|nr:hypothetical protein [Flavobacterium cheonhonense]
MEILLFVLFVCLGLILYQDLKFRKIHVAIPVVLFAMALYIFEEKTPYPYIIYILNLVFLSLILIFLVIYMSVKNKQFLNPFTNYFGLGDLLFYVAISPLFLTREYVLFFICSMVFSIFLQTGLKKIIKDTTVPLAGYSAFLLMLIVVKDLWLPLPKMTIL